MATVKHRVGIQSSVSNVWQAITKPDHLSEWWSSSARGNAQKGSTLDLTFEGLVTLSFEVLECQEKCFLHFQNQGGSGAWDRSHLEFELLKDVEGGKDGKQTFLILTHYNPYVSDEDFQFFMTKWPLFLVSLKMYLETGEGRPYPNDIKIQADL